MKDSKENSSTNQKKKKYIKPEVQTETLTIYGAVCDGTTVGSRKASVGGPSFCNSARLNS
jgi:hypothetical protein